MSFKSKTGKYWLSRRPISGFINFFQSSLFARSKTYRLYLHIYSKYSSISNISALSMDPLSAPDWDLQDIDKDVEVVRFFLAAQSSSRSLVVSRSVYPSVGRKSFVKKLPLLEYKKNI